MSAKKKTAAKSAAKKTAARKSSPRKTAVKSAAKTAARKSTATARQPSKKAARKRATSTAVEGSRTPAKAAADKDKQTKPSASELLKRTRHHTPNVFKVGSRKAAPVVFTLEDVREVLKQRSKEEAKEVTEEKGTVAKKAKAKVAPKSSPVEPVEQGTARHAAASLADILGFGAGPSGSPAQQRSVPRKWKKYHDLLIDLRDHVRTSLGMHAEDTLKRSQKEDSGDISMSSDAGTDSFDRDFALSVVSSEQEALREIEAAIDRIHKGSYGTCEITGESISEERLEAVPFTRFSLEGQRQYEMTARRRTQRTGAFLSEGAAEGVSFGDDDGDN